MEGELQDWEFLHSSDETGSVNSSDSVDNIGVLKGIDVDDSQGMIRTDHFSLDSQIKYVIKTTVEGHAESDDNPSWIDPGSEETRSPRKELGDFCPDSGEDPSECCHKFGEFDDKPELGFVENEKIQVGFEEIGAGGEVLGKFWSNSGGIEPISMEFGGLEHDAEIGVGANPNSPKGSEILAEEEKGGDATLSGEESVDVGAVVKPSGEKEKRSVVWWKVPFEFLKYCAFRVSPVWTFSVAAAVMGFVILGRRLYKMKRKSQSLQLKVTMDDKKVSQFMSRAARLNEAFSVVKRVPVVRPSLPAAGVTPWPVMSLR